MVWTVQRQLVDQEESLGTFTQSPNKYIFFPPIFSSQSLGLEVRQSHAGHLPLCSLQCRASLLFVCLHQCLMACHNINRINPSCIQPSEVKCASGGRCGDNSGPRRITSAVNRREEGKTKEPNAFIKPPLFILC